MTEIISNFPHTPYSQPGGQRPKFVGIKAGPTTISQRGFCLLEVPSLPVFLKLLQSWAGARKGNTKSSAGPREPATRPL